MTLSHHKWVWSNIGECLLQGGDLPSEVNGKPATMQSLGLVEEVSTYTLGSSSQDCVHTCYGMGCCKTSSQEIIVCRPELKRLSNAKQYNGTHHIVNHTQCTSLSGPYRSLELMCSSTAPYHCKLTAVCS